MAGKGAMDRRRLLRCLGYVAPALVVMDVGRVARALSWSAGGPCAEEGDHPGEGWGYGHHCGPGNVHGHHDGGPDDEHRRDGDREKKDGDHGKSGEPGRDRD